MKALEFLKAVHDLLIDTAKELRFDKDHPWHRNLVALHGSLIEFSGSMLICLDKGGKISVPSIFRSMLETYVDFKNLAAERKYGYCMEASYASQTLKLLREAQKGKNPYLADVGKHPELLKSIARLETELKDLKKKGYEPLGVLERFKRAGMEDEYRSMYNLLSGEAHSNISALVSRHLEIDAGAFDVVYYKDEPVERFLLYIDTTNALLLDSGVIIHELLSSSALERVKNLREEFAKQRPTHLMT